jgi:hypothetical protein
MRPVGSRGLEYSPQRFRDSLREAPPHCDRLISLPIDKLNRAAVEERSAPSFEFGLFTNKKWIVIPSPRGA